MNVVDEKSRANRSSNARTKIAETGILRLSSNCWRIEQATRVAVIIDADDYFRAVRSAMIKANRGLFRRWPK